MNYSRFIGIITFLVLLNSCGQSPRKDKKMSTEHKHTNHLINESSPYLLQHAHNPVDWYPWGEEALEKAKEENKLIIVSIGYSACHWCHVMEHESFEDEEVAEFMNEHFVSIKVDREERPDIDQVYMNAVQLINGRGGWPLNCVALPDGRVIYGDSYFPKESWLDVLGQVVTFVKEKPDEAERIATQITNGIKSSSNIVANTDIVEYSKEDLDESFKNWKNSIDFIEGGSKGAPKFPLPVQYQYLLQYNYISSNVESLKAVNITLSKMADGGIYDQVGGGFARYSVDKFWKVPHFEKMLYDNAQLVSLYSVAYQQSKISKYRHVVVETLEFIGREMTSPDGGFYSALDADSEGEEGKFYVWTKKEIDQLLGARSEIFCDYYNVSDYGNWEQGNNILLIKELPNAIANKFNISEDKLSEIIKDSKQILLQAREGRVRPGLDDKILTSWNALMLKGYIDAYRVFNDDKYLEQALQSANFINDKMKQTDNRLLRNYKGGKSSINAFLDDYAFTIDAFIALYQVTFDERWLNDANYLLKYTLKHFFDKKSGMFYYTSDLDPDLIARKIEINDNVIPASNSQMAKNLYVLGHYFYDYEYIIKAKVMLNNVKKSAVTVHHIMQIGILLWRGLQKVLMKLQL